MLLGRSLELQLHLRRHSFSGPAHGEEQPVKRATHERPRPRHVRPHVACFNETCLCIYQRDPTTALTRCTLPSSSPRSDTLPSRIVSHELFWVCCGPCPSQQAPTGAGEHPLGTVIRTHPSKNLPQNLSLSQRVYCAACCPSIQTLSHNLLQVT